MYRFQLSSLIALGVLSSTLSGCMKKMTAEEMKAEMAKRPSELDRLNMFVGNWESEGQAQMACLDQCLKTSGTSEVKWARNNRYLEEHAEWRMGDFDPMYATGLWTYDPRGRDYRAAWVESMGAVGIGEFEYNESTRTWDWEATSQGPMGKTRQCGQVKFVNDDTMEWSMTEYAGLMKTMEMSGTAKRRK